MAPRTPAQRTLRLASFVAFLSTLLIYSPNVATLQPVDLGQNAGNFAEPYLLCVAAFAAACAFASLRSHPSDTPRLAPKPVSLSVAAVYFLANCAYVLTTYLVPAAPSYVFAACAFVGAAAAVPFFLLWAGMFDGLSLRQAVAGVAAAFCLKALCGLAMSAISGQPLLVAYVCLLGLGCLWLVYAQLASPASAGADPTPSFDAPPEQGFRVRPFVSVMGFSLLGMAISSFVMGVQPMFLFDSRIDAQHLGMLLGAAALVPLAWVKIQPAYTFIYQMYLPCVAVVLVVLCVLPLEGWALDVVLVLLSAFFYMVIGIALAGACAIANAREFSRPFVFSVLICTFCAMAMLGIFFGGRFDALLNNNATALKILMVAYACGLFLAACTKSWKLVSSPVKDVGATSQDASRLSSGSSESFEARLERISKSGGLSPREAQIASYVGRGHSSVYVAKTLLISESTVYSHVRNIYRKLNISSREELIGLFNDTK